MTDHEVEQRLGYTPCVCGVIDGAWHPKCYFAIPPENIPDAYKRAFAKARRYLKRKTLASLKPPNVRAKPPKVGLSELLCVHFG